MVFVPITHDLVHAAAVHTACQVAHLLYEVTKERRARSERQMVDVAIQGLVHSKDEFRHATKSPLQVFQDSSSRFPQKCGWTRSARLKSLRPAIVVVDPSACAGHG